MDTKILYDTPLITPPVQSSSLLRNETAIVSFHSTDLIRLFNFPEVVVDLVRNISQTKWHRGIRTERLFEGAYEFKLDGSPWNGSYSGSANMMHATRFINCLFEALSGQGWVLRKVTNVLKMKPDRSVFLFRHQHQLPAPCEWMSIIFSGPSGLRFIDGPPDIIEAMSLVLSRSLQRHGPCNEPGVYEMSMQGHPWWGYGRNGGAALGSQWILSELLHVLEANGFTLHASIDERMGLMQSSRSSAGIWHCCRVQGWTKDEKASTDLDC